MNTKNVNKSLTNEQIAIKKLNEHEKRKQNWISTQKDEKRKQKR